MRRGFWLTILVAIFIILALIVYLTVKPPPPIKAEVEITPKLVDLKSPPPFFLVAIRLPEPYNVSNINVTTVQLDGVPAYEGVVEDDTLLVKFDGVTVANMIYSKLYHMTITPPLEEEVELRIQGKVDNLIFEGTDVITVYA